MERTRLETLWFNTGTLCNLACEHCYIESTPSNDRLVYLTLAEVEAYLDEIETLKLNTAEIGFTGGEPFLNPDLIAMLRSALGRGYRVLLLTNAMRPMAKCQADLLTLRPLADTLEVRVSLDHYTADLHEAERGPRSWQPTIDGLRWLAQHGFRVTVAGRTCWEESEASLRAGFSRLFAELDVAIDSDDPAALVLFPEMDDLAVVPEISTGCWGKLGVDPQSLMCASSRMVVKPKGQATPHLQACTLLAYDPRFRTGDTLATENPAVSLNHAHCAKFCVLGGGSCSAG